MSLRTHLFVCVCVCVLRACDSDDLDVASLLFSDIDAPSAPSSLAPLPSSLVLPQTFHNTLTTSRTYLPPAASAQVHGIKREYSSAFSDNSNNNSSSISNRSNINNDPFATPFFGFGVGSDTSVMMCAPNQQQHIRTATAPTVPLPQHPTSMYSLLLRYLLVHPSSPFFNLFFICL